MVDSKLMSVEKEKLAKIIILVDNGQKLAEALEENNQDCRVLLHSLITNSRTRLQFKEITQKLLEKK